MLAKAIMLRYTTNCCDMIAMKREVAACMEKDAGQVFRGANVKLGNWRQVTVRLEYLLSGQQKYGVLSKRYTRVRVQSPLVVH